jgi:hypothetical protein
MIITSRPKVSQPCEPIVLESLNQLYRVNAGDLQPKHVVPSLPQYGLMLKVILTTLSIAGVLKDFRIDTPLESSKSTYELEKWMQLVRFTGDGKEWYTIKLTYEFRR